MAALSQLTTVSGRAIPADHISLNQTPISRGAEGAGKRSLLAVLRNMISQPRRVALPRRAYPWQGE